VPSATHMSHIHYSQNKVLSIRAPDTLFFFLTPLHIIVIEHLKIMVFWDGTLASNDVDRYQVSGQPADSNFMVDQTLGT
jgi:hypothetical protein